MRLTKIVLSVAAIGAAVFPLFSQTSTVLKPSFEIVKKPSFESASIRLNTNPATGTGFRGEPGGTRMTMTAVTVRMLLSFGYRVRDFQIVDGPDWINTERYDIEAKAERNIGFPTAPQGLPTNGWELRTQSLLEDRFQLEMHRDTRDLPVYELLQAAGGSKLRLSADQKPPRPGSMLVQRTPDGWKLQARNVILSRFISAIEREVDRFVVNKTDLNSGLYDIDLEWADNGPSAGPLLPPGGEPARADTSGPSIFTALQEQLGLRLTSAKGPVEVLVIDSVQKPTVN
jgi:uncharacterized protein (TIGR03435 family)